jgi:hypothetical protein
MENRLSSSELLGQRLVMEDRPLNGFTPKGGAFCGVQSQQVLPYHKKREATWKISVNSSEPGSGNCGID